MMSSPEEQILNSTQKKNSLLALYIYCEVNYSSIIQIQKKHINRLEEQLNPNKYNSAKFNFKWNSIALDRTRLFLEWSKNQQDFTLDNFDYDPVLLASYRYRYGEQLRFNITKKEKQAINDFINIAKVCYNPSKVQNVIKQQRQICELKCLIRKLNVGSSIIHKHKDLLCLKLEYGYEINGNSYYAAINRYDPEGLMFQSRPSPFPESDSEDEE